MFGKGIQSKITNHIDLDQTIAHLIQIDDSLAGLCRIEQSFEEIHLI